MDESPCSSRGFRVELLFVIYLQFDSILLREIINMAGSVILGNYWFIDNGTYLVVKGALKCDLRGKGVNGYDIGARGNVGNKMFNS